jgi:Family of unknown function (DUF6279)
MNRLVPNRIGGIILALGLALALSACSALKLGYTNLPHLAWWWLDGYADFSDEQEPRVRDAIAALHAWHRREELPRVAELLARMEQMATVDVTPQQACSVVGEVQARLKEVARQGEADAVRVAASLKPRQLRHVARKFRSRNERFRKDWIAIPPQAQFARRYEQTLDRLESVYGRLEERQRAVLRERLGATRWDPNRMLERWNVRQQELLQILTRITQGLPEAEGRLLLRAWVDRLERPADADDRAYQEALLQEGCATFAAVHQVTTPEQREQAATRLRAWQRNLRELSAQQP